MRRICSGDQVLALGHDLGGGAGAVVAQRDGEVGGVGDHHVGLGDGGHHPLAGRLRLAAAQRGFDLGGEAVLALLVLELLLGHAQLALGAPALPGVVDRGDHEVGEGGVLGDFHPAMPHHEAEVAGGDADFGGERGEAGDDRERGDAGDDGDLGDGLERLEEDVGPEQVARPRDGVDPLEVERERFGGRAKADLGGARRRGRCRSRSRRSARR